MDWMDGEDGTLVAMAGDGARWVIRPSDTVGDGQGVFRLLPGQPFPAEVDEEVQACAVLRSVGEAQVMAALLDGKADPGLVPSEAYRPAYENEGRQGWWLPLGDGYLSVHRGGDEDLRDVVVTRFSRRSAGQILFVMVLAHGRQANMPEAASPLPAALVLVGLIASANRIDRPLDSEDYRLWSEGRPVIEDPKAPAPKPAEDSPATAGLVREAARLAGEGFASDALLEAAMRILREMNARPPKEAAERERAVAGDVAVQYVLVASIMGKDVADAIVEAGRSPAPR